MQFRKVQGTRFIWSRLKPLFRHPAFGELTLMGNGVIVLGAGLLYWLEYPRNPQIHSFLDTLWWAVATVTTVGHGEVLPATALGKWLGIGMMIFGTALFCSFTALFAAFLLRPELAEVEQELQSMEGSVGRLQKQFLSDEVSLRKITSDLESTLTALKKLSKAEQEKP